MKKFIISENHPYKVCVSCPQIGTVCGGPNFHALTNEQLLDFIRARKEFIGITSAEMAYASNTPLGTVSRIMSGHADDLRISTLIPILKVLVGGDAWDMLPCANSEDTQRVNEELIKQIDHLTTSNQTKMDEIVRNHKTLDEIHASYSMELAKVREEASAREKRLQQEIDYLLKESEKKDKIIEKLLQ